MKHAIKNIHFVGIGGSGMSGIAEVLHNLGYAISGSDIANSPTLKRLQQQGIKTFSGHAAQNTMNADVVVISTAIKSDNPEVIFAKQRGIPVVPRAIMLAELMRMKSGIAIAGTHGKTTTTSLTASILAHAGLDPTFVIGGLLTSASANARLGQGQYIVVEADESDASFLNLLPMIAAITNIDADHMETYGHDFDRLKSAFVDFLHRMPFYGTAILCIDDPAIASIYRKIERPIITYGINDGAQVQAINIKAFNGQMHFIVKRTLTNIHHSNGSNGEQVLPDLSIILNLPGQHNVLNALAAIAIATELEVKDESIIESLAQFKGVGRRFQRYGLVNGSHGNFEIIDDYGHHPAEMAATLNAAHGAFPNQRIILAFQPHRYSRTRDCFEDFVKVISMANVVLLGEVYAAGEAPIVGADSRSLIRAIRLHGKVDPIFIENIDDMAGRILEIAQEGDIVLCMGAGSIGQVASKVVQLAQTNSNEQEPLIKKGQGRDE